MEFQKENLHQNQILHWNRHGLDLKQTITRGELADYLLKLTGDILDAKDMTPEEFCKTYGFMVGDADGNFSAERVLKRAELAAILLRVDNELMSSDDREAGPEQQNIN